MPTATTRTRTRRTTLPLSDEVTKDTTQTKVVLEEEGNEAEIVEQIGGKTVRYNAKVTEDKSQVSASEKATSINEDDSEGIFPTGEVFGYQENPKSGLDKAFDDLLQLVKFENTQDYFFAKIARMPDGIGENFYIPCRERVELGVVPFTTHDRFALLPELQKINNNSGGRLAIDIYDAQHEPVIIKRQWHHAPSQICFTVNIQNPPPKAIEENGNGQLNGLGSLIREIQEERREMMQFMRDSLNRQPEKGLMEKAAEAHVLNLIQNPQQNNGNNGTNGFEQIMMQMMLMPQMINKMSEKMFPEIPLPAEPTVFDRVLQVLDKPIVQNTLQNAAGMLQAAHENKMVIDQKNAGIPVTEIENFDDEIPQPQPMNQPNRQQELIQTIISELESDNEFNASNQTIQDLQTKFPSQVTMLTMACKGGSFDDVLKMLIEQTANLDPYPFTLYLDVEASQAAQDYIFNDAGDRLKTRLLEFYNYVKTT